MALSDLYLSLFQHEPGANGAAPELEHEERPLAAILARLLGRGSELVVCQEKSASLQLYYGGGAGVLLDLEIVQCWSHLRRSKIWQNRAASEADLAESVIALSTHADRR